MTTGIDAAAKGMESISLYNDMLANNLANINTPGFKQSIATFKNFHDVLLKHIDASKGYNNDQPSPGSVSAGSMVDANVLDMAQGTIKPTGNAFDLALGGNGFFTVKTPNGNAYTRNGSFIRMNDGTLSTIEGYPVMGQKGPIKLNLNTVKSKDVLIDETGNVRVGNMLVDKLKIVDFKNKKALVQRGNSLIDSATGEIPTQAQNFKLTQGAIESSNAEVVTSMVNSITGARLYESMSKVIDNDNKTLTQAVQSVGKMVR